MASLSTVAGLSGGVSETATDEQTLSTASSGTLGVRPATAHLIALESEVLGSPAAVGPALQNPADVDADPFGCVGGSSRVPGCGHTLPATLAELLPGSASASNLARVGRSIGPGSFGEEVADLAATLAGINSEIARLIAPVVR